MGIASKAMAAFALAVAMITPGIDAQGPRDCGMCWQEASSITYCDSPYAWNLTCLCNYPAYTQFKACNYWCESPDVDPSKVPKNVCKNITTNASTEMVKIAPTVVSEPSITVEIPKTAAAAGSAQLGANVDANERHAEPTIVVTLPHINATATSSDVDIIATIREPVGPFVTGLFSAAPGWSGRLVLSTISGETATVIEARATNGLPPSTTTFGFCGVPGSSCPLDVKNPETTVTAELQTTAIAELPTTFFKRHEQNTTTTTGIATAQFINDTTSSNWTDIHPGGNPLTGATESKGARDSNKEKACIIVTLGLAIIAFAQIKRSL